MSYNRNAKAIPFIYFFNYYICVLSKYIVKIINQLLNVVKYKMIIFVTYICYR